MPNTTSPLSFPYPESTDPVNVHGDIQALAVAVNNAISQWRPLAKFKALDESVTSSTTLQDDDVLFLDLPVGTWHVEVYALVEGAAAADVKTAFTRTGTMATPGARSRIAPNSGITSRENATVWCSGGYGVGTGLNAGLDGAGQTLVYESIVNQVTVAGRITLQWAQNTSSATPTVVKAGSWMKATRLA